MNALRELLKETRASCSLEELPVKGFLKSYISKCSHGIKPHFFGTIYSLYYYFFSCKKAIQCIYILYWPPETVVFIVPMLDSNCLPTPKGFIHYKQCLLHMKLREEMLDFAALIGGSVSELISGWITRTPHFLWSPCVCVEENYFINR